MRDRFTSALQQALVEAQSLAVGRDHGYIEPAHLLLALVDQSGGTTRTLLNSAGANLATLRSALERDPVDALNDALVLASVLDAQLRAALGLNEE